MFPKAIIFDVDGTLAETEEAHRRAFNEAFEAFSLPWFWSEELYWDLLKTTGGKERMARYVRDHLHTPADIEKIAAIHRRKTAIYGELITRGAAALRPGIAELIEDAKAQGVRLAVATTTSRPNVTRLCEACFARPAEEVFEVIAAGDEVINKKPAPDVFELALSRLGLKPEECVGLEDSRNGFLSCAGAGISCVVSPGVYTAGEDFSGASAILASFSEINTVDKLQALLDAERLKTKGDAQCAQ